MALKWKEKEYGSGLCAEDWSISNKNAVFGEGQNFLLRKGGGFVCVLKTLEGCRRVANCIQRELDKDKQK